MTDPRVMRLLEEILDSGGTPEEACADAPELLWEVRERLKRCRSVDAEIDAIFPPSGQDGRGSSAGRKRAATSPAAGPPVQVRLSLMRPTAKPSSAMNTQARSSGRPPSTTKCAIRICLVTSPVAASRTAVGASNAAASLAGGSVETTASKWS